MRKKNKARSTHQIGKEAKKNYLPWIMSIDFLNKTQRGTWTAKGITTCARSVRSTQWYKNKEKFSEKKNDVPFVDICCPINVDTALRFISNSSSSLISVSRWIGFLLFGFGIVLLLLWTCAFFCWVKAHLVDVAVVVVALLHALVVFAFGIRLHTHPIAEQQYPVHMHKATIN